LLHCLFHTYDDLFDSTGVANVVSLVNDLRVSKKKKKKEQLQGKCTICVLSLDGKIVTTSLFNST